MPTLDIHSPLRSAVLQMAGRTVTPSGLTSREWELLPAEIRLRAMFSARVEHERTLAEMKSRLRAGIANEKMGGATMDRGRFIEEMRQVISQSGYRRPPGVSQKSLQNLKSRARLELIWNMNVAQARGYARWLADMTPEGLANEPCYELVRVKPRMEIRDWPLVWEDHGGKFYGTPGKDYPRAKGRMIAKKTDPIWRWISRFKTPWPPFDWGSGMGLSGIDIDEAEALGVIRPEDAPQEPLAEPFNAETSASITGIPADRVQAILSDFAGDVELRDGRLFLIQPPAPAAMGRRKQVEQAATVRTPSPAPIPSATGKSLSDLIRLPASISHSGLVAEMAQLVADADELHGAGMLRPVTVHLGRPTPNADGPGYYNPVVKPGPTEMWVNPQSPFPLLAFGHELAHSIDNIGLHVPQPGKIYASDTRTEMASLMSVIRGTVAVSRLRALWGAADESLLDHELFARAYVQFLAMETANPILLRSIDDLRKGRWEKSGDDFYPRWLAWSAMDFRSVLAAIRVMLLKAGWKGGAR